MNGDHGTHILIRDLIVEDPDTPNRSYGRALVRRWASSCTECQLAAAAYARIRRSRALYRRRNR